MGTKKTKTNALRLLDQAKIDYRLVEYEYDPDNLDVAKIAADNELELGQVYKTLVCKGDRSGPVVAVVPGDRQLNLKQLAQLSGNKKAHLLPLAQLTAVTGYQRGGCSPLGMKKNYPVFLDQAARQWPEILINAGSRGLLFGIHPRDLEQVIEGIGWGKITDE